METETLDKCKYCDSKVPHNGKCPFVKAFEYDKKGNVIRVEFMTPADYITQPWPISPPQPIYLNPPLTQPQPWIANNISYAFGMGVDSVLLNERTHNDTH